MEQSQRFKYITQIGTAFSPSAPIDRKALFAGRIEQMRDGITAVTQRGQHAIIYGERGVGKTSFANILLEVFDETHMRPDCGLVNCDGTMSFSDIWHTVGREIHLDDGRTLDQLLPLTVTPDDVRHVLQNMDDTLIILDEVDRISDRDVTAQLADTIKNLSDHSVKTTLVLVGVADSVDALIAEHVSIQRNLMQVPMPAMSMDELKEVIDKGAQASGMTIEDEARTRIALLSQGIPHYTHLLCLHAFNAAVQADRTHVEIDDVRTAVQVALSKAMQSVVSAYQNATTSPRKDHLYGRVLLACAMTPTDSLGYFYAGDVRGPMEQIMGKRYEIGAFSQHLNAFTERDRGPVLKRAGTKRKFRFKFVDALLKPYVVMLGLQQQLVKEPPV